MFSLFHTCYSRGFTLLVLFSRATFAGEDSMTELFMNSTVVIVAVNEDVYNVGVERDLN